MIRVIKDEDIIEVLEIYNYFVLNSTATFEEQIVSLKDFTSRVNAILEKYPYLVFEEEGQIIGYAYADLFRTRVAYRFSTEVSVYIHKDHYRKGVAKALYTELIGLLKEQGYHTAIGGLTLPNEASIKLHEYFGFKKVAEFQDSGFKFGQWHSTGFWQLMLKD